jgi:hypothetical protein
MAAALEQMLDQFMGLDDPSANSTSASAAAAAQSAYQQGYPTGAAASGAIGVVA